LLSGQLLLRLSLFGLTCTLSGSGSFCFGLSCRLILGLIFQLIRSLGSFRLLLLISFILINFGTLKLRVFTLNSIWLLNGGNIGAKKVSHALKVRGAVLLHPLGELADLF